MHHQLSPDLQPARNNWREYEYIITVYDGILRVSRLAAAAELVPNKHRGTVQAALDLSVLPWVIFGPLTGGAMVVYHGKLGFRINFYVGLALNFACLVLSWFWYHPVRVTCLVGLDPANCQNIAIHWVAARK